MQLRILWRKSNYSSRKPVPRALHCHNGGQNEPLPMERISRRGSPGRERLTLKSPVKVRTELSTNLKYLKSASMSTPVGLYLHQHLPSSTPSLSNSMMWAPLKLHASRQAHAVLAPPMAPLRVPPLSLPRVHWGTQLVGLGSEENGHAILLYTVHVNVKNIPSNVCTELALRT